MLIRRFGTWWWKGWKKDSPVGKRGISVGGRITIIKSALANLPVYFLSVFRCPASVASHSKKLQRDFLWQGWQSGKKFHLVDWTSVCKPKQQGGLGFSPIRVINSALLRKWLSRIGNEDEGLWRQLLEGSLTFAFIFLERYYSS